MGGAGGRGARGKSQGGGDGKRKPTNQREYTPLLNGRPSLPAPAMAYMDHGRPDLPAPAYEGKVVYHGPSALPKFKTGAEALQAFAEADVNQNGQLSQEEFMRWSTGNMSGLSGNAPVAPTKQQAAPKGVSQQDFEEQTEMVAALGSDGLSADGSDSEYQ